MCEMLGSEPIEDEIPLDISDFSEDVQTVFEMYSMLPDNWDGFGGNYLGKDTSNIFRIFNLYGIDEKDIIFYLRMIRYMDNVRGNLVSQKLKLKQAAEKNSKKPA